MVGRNPDAPEHVWTFLSNYAHVLVCIARQPDVTVREMADAVGITERATHRIVNELVDAGVVTRWKDGRRNRYRVELSTPLRHPLESEKTVGDLLKALLPRTDAAALARRHRPERSASG